MKKILLAALFAASALPTFAADKELLNASYDIARELFVQYNALYQKEHPDVKITQSHAGSSKQANAILQGLKADVVTFNQVTDIDVLAQKGKLLPENWRERLPHHSSPYYSTTAFLVRKGNPKQIENWNDLVKDGVEIVLANPKTSGNGRYAYLGALGYAQDAFKSEAEQHDFLKNVLGHVKVFDTGGRGATTSFVERTVQTTTMSSSRKSLSSPNFPLPGWTKTLKPKARRIPPKIIWNTCTANRRSVFWRRITTACVMKKSPPHSKTVFPNSS